MAQFSLVLFVVSPARLRIRFLFLFPCFPAEVPSPSVLSTGARRTLELLLTFSCLSFRNCILLPVSPNHSCHTTTALDDDRPNSVLGRFGKSSVKPAIVRDSQNLIHSHRTDAVGKSALPSPLGPET